MDFKELFTRELLDLNKTIAADIFEGTKYPWESLNNIHDFILQLGSKLPCDKFEKIGENIWISKTAQICDTASLNGPLIIDENAEITNANGDLHCRNSSGYHQYRCGRIQCTGKSGGKTF